MLNIEPNSWGKNPTNLKIIPCEAISRNSKQEGSLLMRRPYMYEISHGLRSPIDAITSNILKLASRSPWKRRTMSEDHLRQIENRGRTATAFFGLVETSQAERERLNEIIISQHSGEIDSLKEKIEEKNEEILRLHKAIKVLEDKNKKLDIALKTRNEEVAKLKTRITKLEAEKKGLEDKLRNVEGKLDRMEKEVEELDKAKQVQEEENVNLKECLAIMSGEVESVKQELVSTRNENQNLKKEVRDLGQKLVTFLPAGFKEGLPMLTPPPPPDLQASLCLGELSRQLQAKMYKYVFPQLYTPIVGYKVKTIRRDLKRLPTEEANQRWSELQKKLNWNETYEEAIKLLQENRNADAHPKITGKLLREAVEVLGEKGNLKGWLTRERLDVLISMWEQI